jgi:UDP-N-acetylenolpyruvoylglucosamine reductase
LPVSEGINPKELCENTLTEREKRHLQNVACAGSFFKNPIANKETVEMFEIEKDVKSKGNKVPAG